jgi:hypothetical protein
VALFRSFNPPPWLAAHSVAVAEVAAWLALRIAEAGDGHGAADDRLDRRLVEAAALLHDMDKALPASDPARRLGHGWAGGRWLAEHGFPELEVAVASHPVTRLADDAEARRWWAGTTLEARIVAYADKRSGQRLEPLAERFASWRRRYPEHEPGLQRAWPDAVRLEVEICTLARARPEAVRRLPWVRAAGRAA